MILSNSFRVGISPKSFLVFFYVTTYFCFFLFPKIFSHIFHAIVPKYCHVGASLMLNQEKFQYISYHMGDSSKINNIYLSPDLNIFNNLTQIW